MSELFFILWLAAASAGFWEFSGLLQNMVKSQLLSNRWLAFFSAAVPIIWMTFIQLYIYPINLLNFGTLTIVFFELLYTRGMKWESGIFAIALQAVIFFLVPVWHMQFTHTIVILAIEISAFLLFVWKKHPVWTMFLLVAWIVILKSQNPLPKFIDLLGLFLPLYAYALESARRLIIKFERNHDVLTGLHNRMSFNDWVEESVEEGALILLDLDNFRYTNKTFGHTIGDAILREIGQRLQQAAPEPARVFRWGGDEFIIWIPGLFKRQSALEVAQRIHNVLTQKVIHENREFSVQGSMGVACGQKSANLFLAADAALLYGKRQGNNQIHFFDNAFLTASPDATQKNSEVHLHWLSDSLHFLMEHSSKGFVLTDLYHNIIDVNPVFEKLSGFLRNDLIGNRPKVLASPSHFNFMRYSDMEDSLKKFGWWKGSFVNKRPNGELWLAVDEIAAVRLGEHTVGYWALVEQNALFNLEEELIYALERNELQIYYQAKCTADGRVVGAEALLRWLHPSHGQISPGQFIPIAEEKELIIPIGYWLLRKVCSFSKQLQAHNIFLTLSVNISPTQLNDPLIVEHITRILNEHQLEPQYLTLEITESVLLDKAEEAIAKINELHRRGFRISLDDFGTGYSSLSYLKDLPLDEIKIDQAFVKDMDSNENSAIILSSMITLAKQLEQSVVAEGVENKKQLDHLQQLGCRVFQGFYFARPEPAEVFFKNSVESELLRIPQ